MKKYKLVKHDEKFVHSTLDEKVLDDVICDICQKTCMTCEGEKEGIDKQFDFLEINGSFGYWSNHDTEGWDAQVCQDCAVEYLDKLICFTKHDYMNSVSPNHINYPNNNLNEKGKSRIEDFNDFLNERATRVRKIRKLTGEVGVKIVSKYKEED